MKSIIIDIDELSDSIEEYKSKPAPFIVCTIYCILTAFVIAAVWASIFKIDEEVKAGGVFKVEDAIGGISSTVSGEITSCNVKNGDYVAKGDIICKIKVDSLSDTIKNYKNNLKKATERKEMLDVYEDSLDSKSDIGKEYSSTRYYKEFVNRRRLLLENLSANSYELSSKRNIYQSNIYSILKSISQYEERIVKLSTTLDCISNRKNSFDASDTYYYSMINNYISNYNYTKTQYNDKISEDQSELEDVIRHLDEIGTDGFSDTAMEMRHSLESQKKNLESNISSSKSEQAQALLNLENTQIEKIEQLIESNSETLDSLRSSLESARQEKNGVQDYLSAEKIAILTEKEKIATERLEIENQIDEYNSYLKNYNIQKKCCTIVAPKAGYYYMSQVLQKGIFIKEGSDLGSVYPKKESIFFAELYVHNSDIGRLEEGQKVKFEVASFPTCKYGCFTGKIESISKIVTVDETKGESYYIVKVKCKKKNIIDKDGNVASLKNGMACTGKVVIGNKTVMRYLLEKIKLVD